MCFCYRQWKEMDAEKLVDQEEELCYLVANILFTVLWRGVVGASKEAWKVSIVMHHTWLCSEPWLPRLGLILHHHCVSQAALYKGVSKSFWTESITKYVLTFGITH
jgi:hypothetical protein